MNHTLSALGFGLFAAFALPTCFAETQSETFMFTPSVGAMLFDSNRHVENSPFYSVSVGYQFDDIWAGEATFGMFETRSKSTQHHSTGYHFNFNSLYHFDPAKKLNPYIIGGVGLLSAEKLNWPEDDASMQKSALTFNVGGGIKYDLTPTWQLRAEIREFVIRHSINHDFDTLVNVGLTWYFDNPRRTKLRKMKPVHMELNNTVQPLLILAHRDSETA